jgi:hypothetical protein
MGRRVFNTEYAPEEEIEGAKAALDDAGIQYYEIRNSALWLGGGSLCVRHSADYDRARGVIEAFQQTWRERAAENPAPRRLNWAAAVPLLILLILFLAVTIQSLSG